MVRKLLESEGTALAFLCKTVAPTGQIDRSDHDPVLVESAGAPSSIRRNPRQRAARRIRNTTLSMAYRFTCPANASGRCFTGPAQDLKHTFRIDQLITGQRPFNPPQVAMCGGSEPAPLRGSPISPKLPHPLVTPV